MAQRVHQLAKELGISSKELLEKLKELNVEASSHMSTLEDDIAEIVKESILDREEEAKAEAAKHKKKKEAKPKKAEEEKTASAEAVEQEAPVREDAAEKEEPAQQDETEQASNAQVLEVSFPITVKDLAVKLQLKPNQMIQDLIKKGQFLTINQTVSEEVAWDIAANYGYDLQAVPTEEEELMSAYGQVDPNRMEPRGPVITFMGHVDHGKTSLLDAIRASNVVAKERGGITQHTAAYQVALEKGKVSFLDTPGHEAFTQMRARGAHATDIVVLVVAADDGIMPQTREAIDHARAAGVPIVVAINKCDLPRANVDVVKEQLTKHDLAPEDWGGKTIVVPVSAKTGEGIDSLLDMLLLEAEMLELKADPYVPAQGVIIEAHLSKGMGTVSTVLVSNGTLKLGDVVVCGSYWGRVKGMINDRRERMSAAGPADPAEILGLNGVPMAGERFYVVENEARAKEITGARILREKNQGAVVQSHVSLEDFYEKLKQGEVKELRLILKTDVQGTLEALTSSLSELQTKEVTIRVIHAGVGDINESDIMLASASDAVIIGFHVKIQPKAAALAKKEVVDTRLYFVIYEVIEEMRKALQGLLEPEIRKEFLGVAEIRQVFKVSKVGTIAGCMITKGTITRNNFCRVIRDGNVIYEGKISQLKRFKDDAKEVKEGFECGIKVDGFNTFEERDQIEAYVVRHIERQLK